MKYKLEAINEPTLEFGFNQKTIDPRDGIMLFGPYTKGKIDIGNLGIIGTSEGIDKLSNWLIKIEKPVFSKKQDDARPFFPGIEAAFDFNINKKSLQKIVIQDKEIKEYLFYKDKYQRVHKWVNLFTDKLIKYKTEEEIPITVWFVIIPEFIYTYSRPKSQNPSSAKVNVGLKTKYERTNPFLFDDMNALQEAYKYEVNFHNQLKAKLLKHGIITQIIKESTISYKDILSSQFLIENEEKFDSAKAWNICTTLYYKSGGLPWKLGSVRDGVCYIGLVYKKIESLTDKQTACCAAQMFLDSGDGLVFKGNVGPWYNPEKKEFHLSKESAFDLLNKALITFKEKNGKYPKEIFIHGKTFFDDDEWEGFEKAVESRSKVVGVRIRTDSSIKVYREEVYAVPRGMALIIDKKQAYLWTKGFVPRLQTQMGLETPNSLHIQVAKGEADIRVVCSDILSLTKLNYNACIYGDGIPVTLRFADMIGEVLTAGPNENVEVLPFKHYI